MDLLARLAEDPAQAALFLDVDGVLAPIVPRPEDARVPDETRAELRRLNGRYALVACISGRAGDDARRIVGVPELTTSATTGSSCEPERQEWAARLRDFLAHGRVAATRGQGADCGAALPRPAGREAARAQQLEEIAERARAAGFVARFGRKVLELVPPIEANKGTAVRRLLERATASSARSTPATTRPTSTASTRSTVSSSRCGSRSHRTRGPKRSATARTSSSQNPQELVALLRGL